MRLAQDNDRHWSDAPGGWPLPARLLFAGVLLALTFGFVNWQIKRGGR